MCGLIRVTDGGRGAQWGERSYPGGGRSAVLIAEISSLERGESARDQPDEDQEHTQRQNPLHVPTLATRVASDARSRVLVARGRVVIGMSAHHRRHMPMAAEHAGPAAADVC